MRHTRVMSMINVLFFGKLSEDLNLSELTISEPCRSVSQLFNLLSNKHERLSDLQNTPNLLIAINQNMADKHASLQKGDEVAFFPPVTGG